MRRPLTELIRTPDGYLFMPTVVKTFVRGNLLVAHAVGGGEVLLGTYDSEEDARRALEILVQTLHGGYRHAFYPADSKHVRAVEQRGLVACCG
ncbi:MAG: hypothetical protein AB1510_07750 [Bacillota bacterium]